MKYSVIIETRASRDIDEASGWIAERSPEAAERRFNSIEAKINSLGNLPKRCPKARAKMANFASSCGSLYLAAGMDAIG